MGFRRRQRLVPFRRRERRWRRTSMLTLSLVIAASATWASAGATRDAPSRNMPVEVTRAQPAPTPSTTATTAVVVGLGDSVTAGTACECEDFVHLYADRMTRETGRPVVADNDGVPGLTSAGLVTQLNTQSSVRDDVRQASVVVLTIGANDLSSEQADWRAGRCSTGCADDDLPVMQSNIEDAVGLVRALRAGQPTQVVVTTYWNVFLDGQVALDTYGPGYLAWSDEVTRAANDAICAAAGSGATCLDLYTPFKGAGDTDPTPLLAADGDHPNAAGHRRIAETLAGQVKVAS